ncbi:MAG TPA: hypothetical protein PLV70_04930 [Flavobacteriales bacterium]|nr:hypothetical protein [Flavobacteriales bacterium]HRO40464.1 hypothetical protein [Flavobacteriales bacterium]HRP81243.1 hypothetical protein [Flavobacteriales bacterium]HRQ84438.1 hypothetical protein [Flavobacteriales bacterium]
MADKQFHPRRSYRYQVLYAVAAMALILSGFLLPGGTSAPVLIGMGVGFAGAAFVVQYRPKVEYVLGPDRLELRRGALREELPLPVLLDANVVDLETAKSYIRQHAQGIHAASPDQSTVAPGGLTKYCSVPLKRWFLLDKIGLGNGLQGKRRSLVLLRLRDGYGLLLSPKHSDAMASAIGKALRAVRGEQTD